MRSLILFALIGVSSAASVPVQQDRDGGQFTIAVDVDLVVFNVIVTDGKGRPVAGLKPEDFRLTEDNVGQEIELFRAEDAPVTVGLIIDSSGSMYNKRAEVVRTALAFAEQSNPDDELFVVSFNEKAYLGLPPSVSFTSNMNSIRAALYRMTPVGRTALYDAVALGIDHLRTGTRDRKALVVLSDGGDNASRHTLDEVLQLARQSTATIYTIGIYDESDQDRNPRVLRKISEWSGGRSYFPQSLNDLDRVWRDIAGGIRNQYTLGYHSSNPLRDGSFRKVKVVAGRSTGRGLRFLTREGYMAPTGKAIAP